jgi:hypothetical protein
MDCPAAVWHILNKIYFYDFDFTNDFLEMIKTNPEYEGLHEILHLKMCKKFKIKPNVYKDIKVNNSYPMVQRIIGADATRKTMFEFDPNYSSHKENIENLYKEIDEMIEEKKDISDPHTNILILMAHIAERNLLEPHKYVKLDQKYIDFDALQKYVSTKNIELIKKEAEIFEKKYPNVATRWIEFHVTQLQMIKNKEDIKNIVSCINILFPNKQMNMYNDIMYFKGICQMLTNIQIRDQKYVDYPIEKPPYDEYSNMFDHNIKIVRLYYDTMIKKHYLNYISYIEQLLDSQSKFLNYGILSDYVGMLHNNQKFAEVCNIYNKHKGYIMHTIQKSKSILAKLNLIQVIIYSCFRTNNNISKREISEILADINIENYTDYKEVCNRYQHIKKIIDEIQKRDKTIIDQKYNIVIRSKVDETCIICLENIDDANIETVKCPCCNKELGHICCVYKWIETSKTCPNCRCDYDKRS